MLVFDRDGRLVDSWGEVFSAPHGLWIGPGDEVFHADTGFHVVTIHATDGKVRMSLGSKGKPGHSGSPFNMPTRAKRAPNGDIFVSDGYAQNRVHRFSSDGKLLLSWGRGDPVFYQQWAGQPVTGRAGTGPGEFNLPHDVTISGDGRVFVMDRTNNRCQVFDMNGKYLTEWADVWGPNDSFIDGDGVMHIASARGVELRSLDGRLIGRWGEKGERPGQFANSPHGLWIDRDDALYVAEVGGLNRLQKFERL
jgi:sugar lactone lactonase YvrE